MSKSEGPDTESNIYRPYVDLSVANPSLLNPYLPQKGFNGSSISFTNAESPQKSAAEALASYALVKFLTTALSCPFEVSRTLLQIQHIPIESRNGPVIKNEDHFSDEESQESEDEYFGQKSTPKEQATSSTFAPGRVVATDQYGYVAESTNDDATRPPHQLPVLRSGIWNTMRTLIKHPDEGFFSLWKGQFIYWLQDMAQLFLQPTVEGALNDTFNLYDDTIPLIHLDSVGPNIMTLLASHLAVGILLNPLDVIRTRLVAQSAKPSLAKYNGPFHAAKTIIQEEGAEALFLGKDIIPSALYHIIDPFFQHCTPLIIDRWFHLSFSDSPLLFSALEIALSTLQLLMVLPLDTIRKRLQIQNNAKVSTTKPYVTVVRTRKIPYASAIDCAYRVVTEEAFPSALNSKIRPASSYTAHGIGALYKGFSFDFKANILTTVVSSFTGIKDDSDW